MRVDNVWVDGGRWRRVLIKCEWTGNDNDDESWQCQEYKATRTLVIYVSVTGLLQRCGNKTPKVQVTFQSERLYRCLCFKIRSNKENGGKTITNCQHLKQRQQQQTPPSLLASTEPSASWTMKTGLKTRWATLAFLGCATDNYQNSVYLRDYLPQDTLTDVSFLVCATDSNLTCLKTRWVTLASWGVLLTATRTPSTFVITFLKAQWVTPAPAWR